MTTALLRTLNLLFDVFFFFLAFAYGGRVSSAPVSRELGTDNDYKGRNVEFINDLVRHLSGIDKFYL